MSTKVTEEVLTEKQVFTKEEIKAALEIAHSEYMMNVMALLSHDPDNKELTYVKVPVTTPQGGTYLISILHIEGPKVNLRDLAAKAEVHEAEAAKAEKKNG